MKKIKKIFTGLTFLLFSFSVHGQQDSTMYVHYINVGQAACVLLEFPCGAMLIDAGAQDDSYHQKLMDYLTAFFQKRKDLNKTLSLVMVTHPHIDHNEALRDIAQHFHIQHYVDDGLRAGSGKSNQVWMQDNADRSNTVYRSYSFEEITKNGNLLGKTDTIIDPINCSNGDPKIILYSGQLEKKPDDWSQKDFTNYNNQSLVIKVLFGKASFLFTGDLELKGISHIIDEYANTSALDVDVLMVGHHGAANATTEDYLQLVSPIYAIISCGEWNFGKGSNNPFTTFAYGHPRISTLNTLETDLVSKRTNALYVKAAEGARDFRSFHVDKRIYATPWDGTIVIRATTSRKYIVYTEN